MSESKKYDEQKKSNTEEKTPSMIPCIWNSRTGVPVVAQWLTNPTSNQELAGLIPDLAQWVKDPVLLWAVVWVTDMALIPCCCGYGIGQQLQLQFNSLGISICLKWSPKKQKKKKTKNKTKQKKIIVMAVDNNHCLKVKGRNPLWKEKWKRMCTSNPTKLNSIILRSLFLKCITQ